jgi:hypothetical protein
MNQCDGCRRRLPLVGRLHRGEGYDMIACTAYRYQPASGLNDAVKASVAERIKDEMSKNGK